MGDRTLLSLQDNMTTNELNMVEESPIIMSTKESNGVRTHIVGVS